MESFDTKDCEVSESFDRKFESLESSIYLTIASISQTTPNAQPTTRDHQLKT